MTVKQQILGVAAVFLLGLAIGRFTLPSKVEEHSETQQTTDKSAETQRTKTDHSVVTVTETTHPDGSVTKETKTEKNIQVGSDTKTKETDKLQSEADKTVTYDTRRLGISAVAVIRPFSGNLAPIYGGEVTYRILGPIRIGGLGLSDGTVGISLGLEL